MPLTETGEKLRRKYHKEYGGKKEGDRVFFAQENSDKKFKKLITGKKKASAAWWASRLNKLPTQLKMKLIGTLKAGKSGINWWINRLDTFAQHCGHTGR